MFGRPWGTECAWDQHLYLTGAKRQTMVNMALVQEAAYFAIFFFISTANKDRLVSAEHSQSNWKKSSLNVAAGKISCKNSCGLSSRHQKIFAV